MRSLFCLLVCIVAFAGVSAAQTLRKSVSGAEVTGTFERKFTGKFKGTSNIIKIAALGGGKLRIAMDLSYPYTTPSGELTANVGGMDDEFAIDADRATYASGDDDCKMTIEFVRPGVIKVEQTEGHCGFGNKVTADGTYRKISGKKPKF